jgi:hypothetical protein
VLRIVTKYGTAGLASLQLYLLHVSAALNCCRNFWQIGIFDRLPHREIAGQRKSQ